MHYYQFNIADYRKDTTHLSMLEHGAYRQLLDWHYLEQAPIPLETEVVFRRLSARTEEERSAIEIVLKELFTRTNEGYIQHRVMREIELYEAKADRARQAGKLGGRPKKTEEVISRLSKETEEKANSLTNKPNNSITNIKNITQKNKFFADIDPQLVSDYLAVRKAKRAPAVSQTVFDGLSREAKLAGISLDQALRVCIERNWVGFKADWYANAKTTTTQSIADQNKLSTEVARQKLFGNLSAEKDITNETTTI